MADRPVTRVRKRNHILTGRCGICSQPLTGSITGCAKCETPHHQDCWKYNQRCSIYGCDGRSVKDADVPRMPKIATRGPSTRRSGGRDSRKVTLGAGIGQFLPSWPFALLLLGSLIYLNAPRGFGWLAGVLAIPIGSTIGLYYLRGDGRRWGCYILLTIAVITAMNAIDLDCQSQYCTGITARSAGRSCWPPETIIMDTAAIELTAERLDGA